MHNSQSSLFSETAILPFNDPVLIWSGILIEVKRTLNNLNSKEVLSRENQILQKIIKVISKNHSVI